MSEQKSFVVMATADADQSVAPGSPYRWVAAVDTPKSLSGLFAWGDTLQQAREALAATTWKAATGMSPHVADRYDSVLVFTLTRKTFPVTALDDDA